MPFLPVLLPLHPLDLHHRIERLELVSPVNHFAMRRAKQEQHYDYEEVETYKLATAVYHAWSAVAFFFGFFGFA